MAAMAMTSASAGVLPAVPSVCLKEEKLPIASSCAPLRLPQASFFGESLRQQSRGVSRKSASRKSGALQVSATASASDDSEKARLAAMVAENERLKARLAELEGALTLAMQGGGAPGSPAVAADVPAAAAAAAATAAAEAAAEAAAALEVVEEAAGTDQKRQAVPATAAQQIIWPSPQEEPPFWMRWPTSEGHVAAAGVVSGGAAGDGVVGERDPERLHIVHVTAEMAPLAKVGGLGDVVTGLGRACLARGHTVEVMLPFYECLDTKQIANLQLKRSFGSYFKGDWVGVEAFSGEISGVPVVLLKPENHFFRGGRIYGGSYNELEAYLFFSRASLEFLQVTGAQPDVLHIHEWHTAAVALLYWDIYHQLNLQKPRLILTIHNMEHHGECRWEQLDMCGLDGQSYLDTEKAMDDRTVGHNPERLSMLKGGIVYSNTVTTVSPTYANETLCNGWLSNTLLKYRSKYFGVLNGIDTEMWDPQTDPHLPAHFSPTSLAGKMLCKHYVQRGLGLTPEITPEAAEKLAAAASAGPVADSELTQLIRGERSPLVVCVTRLVAQKGIHLIRHAIYQTHEYGGQFVLLGSSPDGRVQGDFVKIAEEFQEGGSVRLVLTYSESLAHQLFAAADMVLVPSMFEPCGLTQMIGMRYGTVPVVRRTGGLADTVFDVDDGGNTEKGNGFVFDGINEQALDSALSRAVKYYKDRPEWWQQLTSTVMSIDNSWNKAAKEYIALYDSIRVRWP
ncbi:hypothetical protein CLOM_g13488 [Closterium sp. NIES-68]|nr:hypothetical protein CLOM_g13488 [Closterium sp. NIES-68]GJP59728.1 hypothetical protein CLOP_g15103 [Closterium sp. NIES-67]GJP86176.1 hypothetical protein CLOP_g16234 [Closterium sp. NIES-67]